MLCLLVCHQAWMQGNVVTLASEVIWLFPYKTSLFHNHAVCIFWGIFSLFLHHFNRIVYSLYLQLELQERESLLCPFMSQVIFLVCSRSAVTMSTSKPLSPQLLQPLGTDATIKVWISLMFALSQSCLSLCDSMDCSPPGPSFCGIFQPKILGIFLE